MTLVREKDGRNTILRPSERIVRMHSFVVIFESNCKDIIQNANRVSV